MASAEMAPLQPAALDAGHGCEPSAEDQEDLRWLRDVYQAVAAWLWTKCKPDHAGRYTIPAASGLIAGEALMAVAIILCAFLPSLVRDLFGG